MSSANSSLRPAWRSQSGGRGFQPPPSVAERGRSSSIGNAGENNNGSNNGGDHRPSSYNKFSALDDEDDGFDGVHKGGSNGNEGQHPLPAKGNSRSEALRQGLGSRSSSLGNKVVSSGRRLADLAAQAPPNPSSGAPLAGSSSHRYTRSSSIQEDTNVIRITRERLLSMRPPNPSLALPESLQPLEGNVIIAEEPQDPVCWDNFDADEIWATVPRRPVKPVPIAGGRSLSDMVEGPRSGVGLGATGVPGGPRRGPGDTGSSAGRWQRGVALPPPSSAGMTSSGEANPANTKPRRSDRDAENPNDLWDDPIASGGAAADFSAFADTSVMENGGTDTETTMEPFDFEKMAAHTRLMDEELHGGSKASSVDEEIDPAQQEVVSTGSDGGNAIRNTSIDPHRPLASVGTTIRSGSGDDVNVFEDFDEPVSSESTPTAIDPVAPKVEPEPEPASESEPKKNSEQEAASLLMAMIGVSSASDPIVKPEPEPPKPEPIPSPIQQPEPSILSPWGVPEISSRNDGIDGISIPMNPWGGPLLQPQNDPIKGLDLQARLREAEMEQKAREAEMARRQQEQLEAQKRAEAARQQQQQQQAGVHSQVESVLMERISIILERSWGRSDLMSILTTLHSEDSRVIPLLNNVEALRALILRHSRRVAIRHDPSFGAEMAELLLTNSQWQQQQALARAQAQQEELRRREQQQQQQQRLLEVENSSASAPPVPKPVNPNAPWFYSDPQQNIQGPFRGEEMRQWLEAGYFKGDLPICQDAGGPFRPLSVIFPDMSLAFVTEEMLREQEEAARRKAAEEQERERRETEARMLREAAEAEERERLALAKAAEEKAERERIAQEEALKAARVEVQHETGKSNGGNESSAQLKMMLGLSSQSQPVVSDVPETKHEVQAPKKAAPRARKKENTKPVEFPPVGPEPVSSSKPVKAWGDASQNISRKSMSEIQREEARMSAMQAMQRDGTRSNSSGWANVAAAKGGTTGWMNNALKITPAPVATRPQIAPKPAATRSRSQVANVAAINAQTAASVTTPANNSNQTSGVDDFGAKMSPTLEKWCKEQMMKLNGTDDLTLISFCMTLQDPNEIRQYLVAYLGQSPQVNSFATEFIQRKVGVKPVKEEWETLSNNKKKGKKKVGGR